MIVTVASAPVTIKSLTLRCGIYLAVVGGFLRIEEVPMQVLRGRDTIAPGGALSPLVTVSAPPGFYERRRWRGKSGGRKSDVVPSPIISELSAFYPCFFCFGCK